MELRSFDGAELHLYEWLDVESPKGMVQLVHGMAEHAGRYDAFARFLNAHGYLVVADDHRGHGRTDEDTLGYRAGDMFGDTLRDESEITGYYRNKFPGLKHILFGFSYGSFLTQAYLGKYGDLIDGAVIAGSSYKKDAEVYAGSFVAALGCAFVGEERPAKFIRKLSFGAYEKKFEDGEWLSADAENNQKYHSDPLCDFTCSFRFYADFFRGLRSLYTADYARSLRKDLPVLLVSGAEDAVGDAGKGVKKLYRYYTEKAGMRRVNLALFEHSRHEFLNEKEGREEKWGTVLDFIESVPARPIREF